MGEAHMQASAQCTARASSGWGQSWLQIREVPSPAIGGLSSSSEGHSE
jgi:hypothetical protein